MRIRIIRSTICDGMPVEAGVVDASDKDAALLIQLKKAVPAAEDGQRTIEPEEKAVLPQVQKRSKRNDSGHKSSGS